METVAHETCLGAQKRQGQTCQCQHHRDVRNLRQQIIRCKHNIDTTKCEKLSEQLKELLMSEKHEIIICLGAQKRQGKICQCQHHRDVRNIRQQIIRCKHNVDTTKFEKLSEQLEELLLMSEPVVPVADNYNYTICGSARYCLFTNNIGQSFISKHITRKIWKKYVPVEYSQSPAEITTRDTMFVALPGHLHGTVRISEFMDIQDVRLVELTCAPVTFNMPSIKPTAIKKNKNKRKFQDFEVTQQFRINTWLAKFGENRGGACSKCAKNITVHEFCVQTTVTMPSIICIFCASTLSISTQRTQDLRQQLWERFFQHEFVGVCQCCQTALKITSGWHMGHVNPAAQGGAKSLDNLRPLCTTCNMSMSNENADLYTSRLQRYNSSLSVATTEDDEDHAEEDAAEEEEDDEDDEIAITDGIIKNKSYII